MKTIKVGCWDFGSSATSSSCSSSSFSITYGLVKLLLTGSCFSSSSPIYWLASWPSPSIILVSAFIAWATMRDVSSAAVLSLIASGSGSSFYKNYRFIPSAPLAWGSSNMFTVGLAWSCPSLNKGSNSVYSFESFPSISAVSSYSSCYWLARLSF